MPSFAKSATRDNILGMASSIHSTFEVSTTFQISPSTISITIMDYNYHFAILDMAAEHHNNEYYYSI